MNLRHSMELDSLKSCYEEIESLKILYQMNSDENAKGLINVPQGKEAYVSSSHAPANIEGMYTEGFTTCNLLVVVNKSSERIRTSLTHVDKPLPAELVQIILGKFDNSSVIYIFKRNEKEHPHFLGSDSVYDQCIKPALGGRKIIVKELKSAIRGISVSRNGDIIEYKNMPKNVLLHKDHYQIDLVRKIRLFFLLFASKAFTQTTSPIYNESAWTEIVPDEKSLCSTMQTLFNHIGIKGNEPFMTLLEKIPAYIANHTKGREFIEDNDQLSSHILVVATAIQQLINCNNKNYDTLFFQNINSIISFYEEILDKKNEIKFMAGLKKICLTKNYSLIPGEICNYLLKADSKILADCDDLIFIIIKCIKVHIQTRAYIEFQELIKKSAGTKNTAGNKDAGDSKKTTIADFSLPSPQSTEPNSDKIKTTQNHTLVNSKESKIDKVPLKLENATQRFFNGTLSISWKEYPKDKLKSPYTGHQVFFFTMNPGDQTQAKEFTENLLKEGFSAKLMPAKNKPLIVVDLTASSPGMD